MPSRRASAVSSSPCSLRSARSPYSTSRHAPLVRVRVRVRVRLRVRVSQLALLYLKARTP
eukprot:scaffold34125_cov48-Phaeocystis_antarctica.AAC.2